MMDSWDILHETMEKVNNFLGDYLISELDENRVPMNEDCPLSPSNTEPCPDLEQLTCDSVTRESEEMSPQPRARSNTWPRRQFGLEPCETATGQPLPLVSEEGSLDHLGVEGSPSVAQLGAVTVEVTQNTQPVHRKNSRRNPWGNCSYSDLIEQAILSSPEKRLTLNQIYDWLISSVSYFSDRQDTVASSGWKNSIRHNLSLHQRFVKVPNEDSGKSSWWTLCPDTKVVTKQRRRATYGESREKIKKRAELARNRGRLMKSYTSSSLYPGSQYQETATLSPLSPFRNRSNSSASSCDENSMSIFSSDDNCLSPFRQRSYSNSNISSASQSSIAMVSDLSSFSSQQQFNCFKDDLSTDLDGIKMEDLSLGRDFMKEYLNPPGVQFESQLDVSSDAIGHDRLEHQSVTQNDNVLNHKNVTILEPRDNDMVCQTVMNNMYPSFNQKTFQLLDEKRKTMIETKLSQLLQEKDQLQSCIVSKLDNHATVPSQFDLKIKLLQDELDRLEKYSSRVCPSPFQSQNLQNSQFV